MEIQSLAYKTDLIFHRFEGIIINREDYIVIRTPDNPDFYWGNFLLFPHAPGISDFENWREIFSKEIGSMPKVKHQTFGWDSPEGILGSTNEFIEKGFRLIQDVVLTAREVREPPYCNDDVTIRILRTDEEWDLALENQIICRDPGFEEEEHRKFKTRQAEKYRKMADSGLGDWYGAFLDGRLVADLGIYHDGNIGRYQNVETHPGYRRKGIAGTMVFAAGQLAMKKYGLDRLVIVAEENSSPQRVYQSVGFTQTEKQVGLEWWEGMNEG